VAEMLQEEKLKQFRRYGEVQMKAQPILAVLQLFQVVFVILIQVRFIIYNLVQIGGAQRHMILTMLLSVGFSILVMP